MRVVRQWRSVALLGPAVAAAAAELLHVLVIVAGVIVGVGAISLVGLLLWRWRRLAAARAVPPARGAVYPLHGAARAAQPPPNSNPRSNGHQRSACTCTACPPRTSPPSSPGGTAGTGRKPGRPPCVPQLIVGTRGHQRGSGRRRLPRATPGSLRSARKWRGPLRRSQRRGPRPSTLPNRTPHGGFAADPATTLRSRHGPPETALGHQ